MSTTGIFNQFYEVSSKLRLAKEHSQALTSNPPATIPTIDIDGVSVIEYQGHGIPNRACCPFRTAWNIGNYTPSEAFGYAMRNAVAYGVRHEFCFLGI